MRVYKVAQHLDRRTPIGWFTTGEWGVLVALAGVAFMWVNWLSPFGFQATACGVVVIVAPIFGKAHLRGLYEMGLGHRLRGAARVRVVQRHHHPGAGTRGRGYVLRDDSAAGRRRRGSGRNSR